MTLIYFMQQINYPNEASQPEEEAVAVELALVLLPQPGGGPGGREPDGGGPNGGGPGGGQPLGGGPGGGPSGR